MMTMDNEERRSHLIVQQAREIHSLRMVVRSLLTIVQNTSLAEPNKQVIDKAERLVSWGYHDDESYILR